MFKFKKCERAIVGPSRSDSLATLENKFEKTFLGFVCMGFLKKVNQKKEF